MPSHCQCDAALLHELQKSHLHLWLVDEEDVIRADILHRFPSLLSQKEHERWLTINSKQKQREFLIARGALRLILGQYVAQSNAGKLNIVSDPFGKPALQCEGQEGIQFNLSHSRGKILIGVSANKRIGVDIEYVNPNRSWEDIATQYYHPDEWSNKRSDSLTLEKFYKLWTLKEAFLKAEGKGMSIPLDHFYFECDNAASPKLVIDIDKNNEDIDATAFWSFHHQSLKDKYSLAVCVEGDVGCLSESIKIHNFMATFPLF